MLDLVLRSENRCQVGENIYPCLIGKGGLSSDKKEGDGATPMGVFPLRYVLYRSDRVSKPITQLPIKKIHKKMGWCDDPLHLLYNQLIKPPFSSSHEQLWREDHLYDILIVVGYNDDPVIPGKGSAIFIHLTLDKYSPTKGCIGFSLPDLEEILPHLGEESQVLTCPNTPSLLSS